MWVPDLLNRVITGAGSGGMTACEIMAERFNNVRTATKKEVVFPLLGLIPIKRELTQSRNTRIIFQLTNGVGLRLSAFYYLNIAEEI
jgi:hypothetical protein